MSENINEQFTMGQLPCANFEVRASQHGERKFSVRAKCTSVPEQISLSIHKGNPIPLAFLCLDRFKNMIGDLDITIEGISVSTPEYPDQQRPYACGPFNFMVSKDEHGTTVLRKMPT